MASAVTAESLQVPGIGCEVAGTAEFADEIANAIECRSGRGLFLGVDESLDGLADQGALARASPLTGEAVESMIQALGNLQ